MVAYSVETPGMMVGFFFDIFQHAFQLNFRVHNNAETVSDGKVSAATVMANTLKKERYRQQGLAGLGPFIRQLHC